MNNVETPSEEVGSVHQNAPDRIVRFHITDRRLNPSGKNLNNRQRFMKRVRKKIENSVAKGLKDRGIVGEGDTEISISTDGIDEPKFVYDSSQGIWDHMLPGNQDYTVGDTIPRPKGNDGGGGSEGSPDGEGEDDFRFYISREEYIDALFGDLALPEMVKQSEKQSMQYVMRRAGYTPVGAASNLALERTMIQGISRRIALKTPKLVEIKTLMEELENETDEDRRKVITEQIEALRGRALAIPFLDKSDLRYHNTVRQQIPITRAVMFCLMDVSGSMTEHMKDLAKRFYILLYIFLQRQYKDVDVVFIRHTHEAGEVDEETFFHSPETGGTVVSTAYAEMSRIVRERYPIAEWNIYAAQASDGDNTTSDTDTCKGMLNVMLPWIQYFTYIEVGRDEQHFPPGFVHRSSDVWTMMENMMTVFPNSLAIRRVGNKNDIVDVFRSLFKKREEAVS
jgi:uncharacterized sporulation protein YeaH/YhbH (DUF444 family)